MDTSLFAKPVKRPRARYRTAIQYGWALFYTFVALVLVLLSREDMGRAAFLWLFAGVILAARYGGLGPGILAAFVSSIGAHAFLLEPFQSFIITSNDQVILAAYFSISCLATVVLSRLKRTTETLREREAQLVDYLESAPIGLSWIDASGRILWANQAELDILACSSPDYVGKSWSGFHEDPQLAQRILDRVSRGETVVNQEARLLIQNSAAKVVILNANAFCRDDEFVYARCFTRDISERKAAEKALVERQAFLRMILDANPNLILVKDRSGRIRLANEALSAAYQLPLEQLVGRLHHELHEEKGMSLEEVDQWLRDDEEVIATQKAKQIVEPFTHRDGSLHWYQTRKLPLSLDENQHCVLIISEDITERRTAQDELKKLNLELERRVTQRTAQLEDANKELKAFSYSISHDLRAPLRAVQGFTQIIHEEYQSKMDAECARLFTVISSNARRMARLIDDLLAFSKISRQELEQSPVDMTAIVRSIIEELSDSKQKIPIALHELPPSRGDRAMLEQVFTNLISNALKFTRKVPEPAIEVGGRSAGDEQLYYVRDNGVGFDMKYAQKLFQVFQRLHSADQFEGTGVGLAIVQRIIHRHGGRVWAESQIQAGTTIYFTLPAPNFEEREVPA